MTITELRTDLAEKIRAETGENVFLCYQCVKCTSGCPLAEYFDLAPNQVMRAAQLGQEDLALYAKTPWLCASCQTCTTRCPQGIDVAKVMDFMVKEAGERGIPSKVPEIALFHKVFLRNVNLLGRAYELGLIAEMNLRTGQPFKDAGMGLDMIRKGKIKLTPAFVRPPIRSKPVEKRPGQIGYYPGCSLHSMASEYDHSIHAVAEALGLELVEPEGWVCCGSSPAHRSDPELAVELPLKNLALIEQMGLSDVTVPCAMCFSRFRTALHETEAESGAPSRISHHASSRTAFRPVPVGRFALHAARPNVAVHSLLDTLTNQVGLAQIRQRVTKPLAGLKVACYYGCLLTRPPKVTQAENPEYPQIMDHLMSALGATPVDWGSKTACCGASLSLTRTEIALDLSARIIADARAAGADAVVVACPLCHTNLDGRQHQMTLTPHPSPPGRGERGEGVPVLYLTQLMALAFGLGEKAAALSKNMIDPRPMLTEKGFLR